MTKIEKSVIPNFRNRVFSINATKGSSASASASAGANANANANANESRKKTIKAGINHGPLSKEQIAAFKKWGNKINFFKKKLRGSKTRKNQRKRK